MPISSDQHKAIQAAFQPGQQSFADNPYGVYALLRELDEPFYYEDMNVYRFKHVLGQDACRFIPVSRPVPAPPD